MTKVIVSPDVRLYRQAMAKAVDQVRRETTVAGVQLCRYEQADPQYGPDVIGSDPLMAGLLAPPRIEMLWPDVNVRHGQLNGLIQIRTSGDFGVLNVYVIIRDERGNLVESDFAMRNPIHLTHWVYCPGSNAGAVRSVTVQAIVMDCLGAMDVKSETVTLR